ncbi:hypothetical protein SMSP2_01179 [Limihaloglobus sulfuriphilus]|uniref:Uncharacterized protein n=1 Tax=Limihaloglobus sulfuriphilus TaxID=1851148 RepID=A0A1Q2MEU8_9BACT|nr:HYExAFE family protein [Limihaloglobus sulfuriphilus]AQQ70817.1 hypothetical protein SMSP2_01179 [Limihaloglobus sulfuriphilus]
MKTAGKNHYEQAFEAYLSVNSVVYSRIRQESRFCWKERKIKSFDYFVRLANGPHMALEVKGRSFYGKTLDGLKGAQSWVSADDIEGLDRWLCVSQDIQAAGFIFAYLIKRADFDGNGAEIFEFDGRYYAFYYVDFNRYCNSMKRRSSSWRTVYMPAASFRQAAVETSAILRPDDSRF